MSTNYNEDWRERKLTRSTDKDGKPVWTARRAWDYVLPTSTTTEQQALEAVAEAQLGQPHDSTGSLRVNNNGADRTGFGLVKVFADYTIPTNDKPNNSGDPLQSEPVYDFNEQVDMV